MISYIDPYSLETNIAINLKPFAISRGIRGLAFEFIVAGFRRYGYFHASIKAPGLLVSS